MIVRTTLRLLAAVAAVAASLALLAACGGDGDDATTGAAGGTPVELLLDWFPNADHAGVFAALGQGHFAAEGLAVTATVPSDATAALKEVGAGRQRFAISYAPEVLLARSQGVPVVAVGALIGHPLNSIIVRADSPIKRPRDLKGRTVGQTGLPLERPLLETVVAADGGDPTRVNLRSVGYNLAPALAGGRVDAIVGAYWNIESVDLAHEGIPTRVFRVEEFGVPDYDELVIVTSDTVAENEPELVRSLLAGLRRGQEWVGANQEGAVDHLLAANGDLKRTTVSEQVALTAPLLIAEGRAALAMDRQRWSAFASWMRRTGQLKRPVTVADAMTDRFLSP